MFMNKLRKQRAYRSATPTLSILTITSNVVYGKKPETLLTAEKLENLCAGSKSDAWKDINGALAVLNSIAKLPYEYAQDGISYTFSIIPKALEETRKPE